VSRRSTESVRLTGLPTALVRERGRSLTRELLRRVLRDNIRRQSRGRVARHACVAPIARPSAAAVIARRRAASRGVATRRTNDTMNEPFSASPFQPSRAVRHRRPSRRRARRPGARVRDVAAVSGGETAYYTDGDTRATRRSPSHAPFRLYSARSITMATTQEVKLFGKWTFDDVEVRALHPDAARRTRGDTPAAMPMAIAAF